jgi:hypothetical protein
MINENPENRINLEEAIKLIKSFKKDQIELNK